METNYLDRMRTELFDFEMESSPDIRAQLLLEATLHVALLASMQAHMPSIVQIDLLKIMRFIEAHQKKAA